jgi:hypothetical protein
MVGGRVNDDVSWVASSSANPSAETITACDEIRSPLRCIKYI